MKDLLKPPRDQVVLLISTIRIDFGEKRKVDKQWRLVPILDEVHSLGGISQRIKLLLLGCIEELSSFLVTFRFLPFLPLSILLGAKKLRPSDLFHRLPFSSPLKPSQLEYALLLLVRVHVCFIPNIETVKSVKPSFSRGVQVGAKA